MDSAHLCGSLFDPGRLFRKPRTCEARDTEACFDERLRRCHRQIASRGRTEYANATASAPTETLPETLRASWLKSLADGGGLPSNVLYSLNFILRQAVERVDFPVELLLGLLSPAPEFHWTCQWEHLSEKMLPSRRLSSPGPHAIIAAVRLKVARMKSTAVRRVKEDAEKTTAEPVPLHLRNPVTGLMRQWDEAEGKTRPPESTEMTRPLLILLATTVATLGAADDEARGIVRRSMALHERNAGLARNYTFLERIEERRLDSKGRETSIESRTYDTTILYGIPYRRLIQRDDRPLSPHEARKEQEKLARTVTQSKSESEAQKKGRLSGYEKHQERGRAYLREIPDAFDFRLLAEEQRQGRRPRYRCHPASRLSAARRESQDAAPAPRQALDQQVRPAMDAG